VVGSVGASQPAPLARSGTPPWWYVLGLEHRRAAYFPAGADVKVSAAMSEADKAARRAVTGRRPGVSAAARRRFPAVADPTQADVGVPEPRV